MSRVRKYIKKGSKHLISKFQTIHSSKFLVNKQNGNKGYNDDFMPHTSTKTTTCCYVLNTHTDANHTDGSVNLYRSLGQQQEITIWPCWSSFSVIFRRWILHEIFIDTDFLVSLLFFRVRILSEKKRTVSKFSDEVDSLRWFKHNAFAGSLW